METCGCCDAVGTGFKQYTLKSLDPEAPKLSWFVCIGCERRIEKEIIRQAEEQMAATLGMPRSSAVH